MLKHHEPYEGGVFAGRQDILHFVEAGLGPAVRGAVLLWGLRRLGKTAILRELQRRLPSPTFLPVYFPLGQRAQAPLSRVLFDLASALCGEVQMDPVQAEDFSEGAGTAFFLGEFLPAFYRALPEAYRPVLLLDDLDALQPGGKGDGTTNALPLGGFLQQLCASEPRLGFVFTTTRRPDELSPEVHAIVYATGAAREREVPPLAAEDVREVLAAASPAERTAPVVEEGAVVRVLELTGGHPHLVQVVCRTLLFHLPQGDDEVAPLLDGRNVEDASSAALQAASGFFEDLWRELPPAERVVLSALAEAAPPGAALGQAELLGALQRLGIRILTPELEYAPESLRRRGLLRETAHGHSFSIELLRRFAAAHRPPAAVKPELEHSVPAAAALFHGATSLHQQGQLEQAREMLRRTLRANPNHVKARIRLGQVLHELGQLE